MKNYVALKIVKSASHYTETAVDEMKLLQMVSVMNSRQMQLNVPCNFLVSILKRFAGLGWCISHLYLISRPNIV